MFVLWDNGMFDSPLLHPLNKHHQLMSVRWHTCDFVCIYVPWNIYLHPWCAFATKGLKTDRMGVCYQTFGFKTTLFLYEITCFSTTLLLLSFRADGLRTSFMICFYYLQSVAMVQASLISSLMWFLTLSLTPTFATSVRLVFCTTGAWMVSARDPKYLNLWTWALRWWLLWFDTA